MNDSLQHALDLIVRDAKAKALDEAAAEWAADPDEVGDSFADARNWLRARAGAIRSGAL